MVKLNTNTSVVDYLKSTGKDSSYGNRSTLAKQYKINNYAGTQAQNVQLLNALKASQAKPVAPKVVAPKPVVTKKPTTSKPPAQKPTTVKPTFDQNAYSQGLQNNLNNMYDAQQASQLSALQANKDKAIGDINLQMGQTSNEAQQNRNQADVVSAQNVQRLRELMASQGLNNSGENVTANVGLQNARQSALNNVNTQEQQAMDNFRQKIADINDPYQTQAIINDIAAQRSKALYGAQQDAFNNGLSVAGLTGNYNGQSTLAKQQMDTSSSQWQKQFDAQQKQALNDAAWQKYIFGNLSADQKAQLGLNKYQIDTGNQTDIGSNQALLNYYKSLGFNSSKGGSGAVPQSFQQDMAQAVQKGVPAEWAPVLSEIVRRESSYNPNAKNPTSTAYGYGQFLDSTRKAYEKKTGLNYNNPVNQLIMMAQYVKDRYKNPENALRFWKDNQYY